MEVKNNNIYSKNKYIKPISLKNATNKYILNKNFLFLGKFY